MKKLTLSSNNKQLTGFTIVELLVVIVIIGILAAITIVSYTGITAKANITSLTSDLATAKKQIAMYYIEHGVYPTGLNGNNCLIGTTNPSPDTNYCLKSSSNNKFALIDTTNTTYGLTATNIKANLAYEVTESTAPATTTPDWITIGTQTWAKTNLNVGIMVTGITNQTNNSITEKYCYNNLESNCTTYGALYQWDEAMQYTTSEGAQGICPAGSHIPTDAEWKTLEMSLSGMSQATADLTGYRGTDEGTKLKSGTPPGLNMPLAGSRYTGGSFGGRLLLAALWSSSESSTSAWYRYLDSTAQANRDMYTKANGMSIRCLGN